MNTRDFTDGEPANEYGRLIVFGAKLLRRKNHEQTYDQVDDRDAGKERCQATHDIMEDGKEPEVITVGVLLLDRRAFEHDRKMP
jgi:hypothetical protein